MTALFTYCCVTNNPKLGAHRFRVIFGIWMGRSADTSLCSTAKSSARKNGWGWLKWKGLETSRSFFTHTAGAWRRIAKMLNYNCKPEHLYTLALHVTWPSLNITSMYWGAYQKGMSRGGVFQEDCVEAEWLRCYAVYSTGYKWVVEPKFNGRVLLVEEWKGHIQKSTWDRRFYCSHLWNYNLPL